MRRWLILLLIFGMAVLPFSVQAQGTIKFSTMSIQLWPEYDRPSMLVISEFQLPDSVSLPVNVNFRIPKDAILAAVASLSGDQLINAQHSNPTTEGDGQIVQVAIQTNAIYHIEYYAPISKTGTERQFTYQWLSDYPVDDFTVGVWPPTDITQLTTNPPLSLISNPDGTSSWKKDFGALAANQPFTLKISYNKTTDTLTKPASPDVQPSQPIGANTPGSFMATFSHAVPYLVGVLGLILISGGVAYFWQTGRRDRSRIRKRRFPRSEKEGGGEVYCHQCGTHAHKEDRFCRVCGTKLRREV
ncbi:MAG TPA: zinc ribbon domain-containing protein [Anaerolineales bacterium]|nr:zinc ribbon domain-containing protein [Anaerolineales bacterium]